MKATGSHFVDELASAGLAGLPFSWGEDGIAFDPSLAPEQRAAIQAVYDAHDAADATKISARKAVLAARDIDAPALKAVVRALLDEIDARHPTDRVNRGAFRQRAIGYLRDLLP